MAEHIIKGTGQYDTGVVSVNRVVRSTGRTAKYSGWSDLRQLYVLGERTQGENGIYVSKDISYQKLADLSGLSLDTLKKRGTRENWVGLRRAYLARVGEINAGHELGFYSTENYQAEIASMNAATKLGVVLNRYLDDKFGNILSNEIYGDELGEEDELVEIKIADLKDAVKVAMDVYTLQRKIYDNAPRTDIEMYENEMNKNQKYKLTDNERKAKIKQLEAKIGKSFNKLFELNNEGTVRDVDAEVIN